jgi:hypothetical protein
VSTCGTQQVWGKYECKGFIVDWLKAFSILVGQVLLAPDTNKSISLYQPSIKHQDKRNTMSTWQA